MGLLVSCSVFFFMSSLRVFFFFNDTATTEIYTLSLHDALPISVGPICTQLLVPATGGAIDGPAPATALVAAAGASAAGADAAAGAAAGTAVPGDSSALPSVRAASSAWSLKSAVRLMVLSGPPRRAARGAGRPVAAAAAASMLTLGTTVSSPE